MSNFWDKQYMQYEQQVVAPNMHHSLFLICHLCVLPHLTLKIHVQVVCERSAYWTTALLSDTFLIWFRVAWDIQLVNYSSRQALQSFSDRTLSRTHCKPIDTHVYLHITIWCTTTNDNKTHIAYECTTYQTMALLPTMHNCMTKLAGYSIHVAVCFQLHSGCYKYMYTSIKINKEYYHTSWKA